MAQIGGFLDLCSRTAAKDCNGKIGEKKRLLLDGEIADAKSDKSNFWINWNARNCFGCRLDEI